VKNASPHQLVVHLRLARRDHRVEPAHRVAQRALALVREQQGRALGQLEADALRVRGLAPLQLEQPVRDLAQRHAREVEALGARADGLGQLLRVGGGEDEHQVRRRLLQRLQERREGVARELVDLVDDDHAVLAAGRREADLLAQRLHVGDTAVRGAVDLGHVQRHAGRDLAARGALVAGLGRAAAAQAALLAVERLGDQARAAGLADAAGAGEEVGVGNAAALERPGEHGGDVLLPDHVGERLRPVLQGKSAMGHGGPHSTHQPPGGRLARAPRGHLLRASP
jgi:hypothetical protein